MCYHQCNFHGIQLSRRYHTWAFYLNSQPIISKFIMLMSGIVGEHFFKSALSKLNFLANRKKLFRFYMWGMLFKWDANIRVFILNSRRYPKLYGSFVSPLGLFQWQCLRLDDACVCTLNHHFFRNNTTNQ